MDFNTNFTEAQAAQLRQEEFPQMLRDIVASGANEIELVIDAHTALRIAEAVEAMTQLEVMLDGKQ